MSSNEYYNADITTTTTTNSPIWSISSNYVPYTGSAIATTTTTVESLWGSSATIWTTPPKRELAEKLQSLVNKIYREDEGYEEWLKDEIGPMLEVLLFGE